MLGSALVRDPKFQARVVAETRALPVDDSHVNESCARRTFAWRH
jgi:hypothetical protein